MGISLDELRRIAIENLEGALGHLAGGADPLTRETALAELEGFFERNGEAITGASTEFVFGLIMSVIANNADVGDAVEQIDVMSADTIADLAERTADEVEEIGRAIAEGRRQLLDDVKSVLGQLARGALAAALAGLAGAV